MKSVWKRVVKWAVNVLLLSMLIVMLVPEMTLVSRAEGTCGDNVTWTLDAEGTLTISGTGAMYDYKSYSILPWSWMNESVTKIVIESGVTHIGDNAFGSVYSCINCTDVSIAGTVTSIGTRAFTSCSSLTQITIPNSVTSIGDSAFAYCSSLVSIHFSDTLTSFGKNVFQNCGSLTSVDIPSCVTSLSYKDFSGCSSLKNINVPADITDYSSLDGVLYNKEQTNLICYPAGRSGSYVIPDSVTSIGSYAFDGCSLTSVTIPARVTSVGSSAFRGCTGLTTAGPIGGGYDCEFGWTEEIPANAFEECSSLTRVEIPDGMTSIGSYAFEDCSLTSVRIPVSVTSIGSSAFRGCTGLTTAGPIGGGYDYEFGWTEEIPAHAFDDCSYLMSAEIPDSAISIGEYAFSNCSSLKSVEIPTSVISIGSCMFIGCKSLTSVTIPANVTSIGNKAFSACSSLESLTVPAGVTSIGYGVFSYCSSLKNLVIPAGVTNIGNYAFDHCSSLESVTIPAGVTSIGSYAFEGCSNLTSIYFKGNLPSFGIGMFDGVTATAYYPEGDSTWSDIAENPDDYQYGGTIIWLPWDPEADENMDNEAIIVIPGIAGSELQADEDILHPSLDNIIPAGQKVWLPETVNDYISFIMGESYAGVVGCDSSGKSYNKISPVSVSPTDGKIGTMASYTDLVHLLYETYDKGTDEKYDVQFFSYDWRMSITQGADALKKYIEDKGYSKVILVCHSMGGLVASQYIKNGNAEKIDKLITIATPYYGAPKALNVLETGDFIQEFLMDICTSRFFKTAAANLPTVYELMPANVYMENQSIAYVGDKYSWTPLITPNAKEFIKGRHNESLYTFALKTTDSLMTDNRYAIDQVDSYVITADYGATSTIGGVVYYSNLLGQYSVKDLVMVAGDGTVPVYSATLGGRTVTGVNRNKILTIDGKSHSSIVNPLDSSSKTWKYITAAIGGNWKNAESSSASTYSLQSNDSVSEDNSSLTKIRIEGSGNYKITDISGNVLLDVSDNTAEIADGYEYSFYFLDDDYSTLVSFLDAAEYQIYVSNVSSGDFECDVVEYDDYKTAVIENATEYKISGVVDAAAENVAVYIHTGSPIFEIDTDGDSEFDTQEVGITPVFAESISLDQTEVKIWENDTIQLTATVKPDEITYPNVIWISSDPAIAEVSENGEITGISAGTATIKAFINGIEANCEVTVIKSLDACSVELPITEYTYSGKAITPGVIVKNGFKVLVKDTDYLVSYSNNINAGTAALTITGIGAYTGTIEKTFTINKAPQTVAATISSDSILYGKTAKITAEGKGTISYKSGNTDIATVSSKGVVTGKGAGKTTIIVTAAGDSNYEADSTKITVTVSLQKPSLSGVTNTSKGVTVKWNKIPGASKYRVFRRTSGTKWKKVADTSLTSYTDTTAKSGTTYSYTVRCISSDGKTFTSSYDTKGKSIKYLSRPSVTSVANISSGITVKWKKVTGASGYYVYRKTGTGSWKMVKKITKGTTLSFTDAGVKSSNGTSCYYKINAYSGSYTSSDSAGKKLVRLTTPSITKATNSSSKKMTVTWGKNSKATGYQIKYVTGSTAKTVTVKSASTVNKVISGLTKGKTYKVYVRSYRTVSGTNYYSAWSSARSVKITK